MNETVKEKQQPTELIIIGTFFLGLLEMAMLYYLVSNPSLYFQDFTYVLGWMVVTFCFFWNVFTIFERRQTTKVTDRSTEQGVGQ